MEKTTKAEQDAAYLAELRKMMQKGQEMQHSQQYDKDRDNSFWQGQQQQSYDHQQDYFRQALEAAARAEAQKKQQEIAKLAQQQYKVREFLYTVLPETPCDTVQVTPGQWKLLQFIGQVNWQGQDFEVVGDVTYDIKTITYQGNPFYFGDGNAKITVKNGYFSGTSTTSSAGIASGSHYIVGNSAVIDAYKKLLSSGK